MTSKIATDIAATVLTTACAAACAAIPAAQVAPSPIKPAELQLEAKWDKVFAQSSKVNHSKITFVNRYGITLAADLYVPKNAQGKLPAIAVSGPSVPSRNSPRVFTHRRLPNADISRLPLILRLPEKAAVIPVM